MSKYKLTDEQQKIVDTVHNDAKVIKINAYAGSGKAQPMYSNILTENGWVRMKDIKIGDIVATSNGDFSNVIGIYPRGKMDIYRVYFNNGDYTDCTADHLWTTKTDYERFRKMDGMVRTTREILKTLYVSNSKKTRVVKNHSIPYVKPINFSKKHLPIHPYVLGCLIGDGSLHNKCSLWNNDIDIVDRVGALLPTLDMLKKVNQKNEKACECYNIQNKEKWSKSITSSIIECLGLNVLSYNKFIPEEYKLSNVEDRIELLRGLIDTDGHISPNTSHIEYSTVSLQLANDVAEIVRSLGGYVTINNRMGKYNKDGIIKETCVNYRVNIHFYNDVVPVYCKRKLDVFKKSTRKYERYISKIEKIGNEDVQCIKVSAKDSLYITDNYILTHNTSTLIDTVEEIRKIDKDCKILYLVFNKSMVSDSKVKFDQLDLNVECQTIHGWALKRFSMLSKDEIEIMPNLDYSDYMKVKSRQNKYKYSKYKNTLEMFKEYGLTFDNLSTFCFNMKNGYKGQSKYNLEKLGIRSYEVEFFEELYKYFISNKKYLHSMYLKEYACNTADKVKGYKYLLVDEFQDLNLFGMNIIKKISYDKLYVVGDIFQAIYGFNRCINGFEKLEGETYPLSVSFRFNDKICKLANDILDANFKEFKHGSIKNFHNKTEIENKKEKAILFRKNASLFEYAVNLISNADNIRVKFIDIVNGNKVGDFDSVFSEMIYFYDRLLESSDSEHLAEFRNKFRVVSNKTVNEFVKIAEKEGLPLYKYLYNNKQVLSLDMMRLFNFYLLNEKNIVEILEKVRTSEECINPDKTYVLMTAHSSKGMEFDHVKIADDAWKMSSDDEKSLCYVAITRAKYRCDCEPILRLMEEKYSLNSL